MMHRIRPPLVAGLVLLVAAAQGGGATPACAEDAAAPAPSATVDPRAPLQPPDGRWLRDAEGNDYFALKVRQPKGSYEWANADKTRARTAHGVEVEVLAHDDDSLTVKIYRTDQDAAPAPPPGPTKADLERVAATYATSVQTGKGARLKPLDTGLPQRGQWRNGFATADVDGDGHLDIIFGPARKSRRGPVIFRGDGAGSWTVWQDARFPNLPFDYGDAAAGDLNGDGKVDVVLASHLRGITAMLGDGKGGFTEWSRGIEFGLPGGKDAKPGFTSRAITLADWNRDGRPDVIAIGEGPQLMGAGKRTEIERGSRGITVYLNGGDGSWTKRSQLGSGSFGNTLAVADVNGDGLLDIVAGSERRGFRGILNLGQPDGSWRETVIEELRPDAIQRAVAVADFNRDGKNDIAVGYLSGELDVDRRGLDVLLNRGDGWQRETLLADPGRDGINAVTAGDFDGDGNPDLAALDQLGVLQLFLGDGKGGFTRAPLAQPAINEQCAGYGLAGVKVAAGSADDIVASFADESDDILAGGPSCPSQGSLRSWKPGFD
jgi:hypothetical protein